MKKIMTIHLRPHHLILLSLTAFTSQPVNAQNVDTLTQCHSQYDDLDLVHDCMDAYLDTMDARIGEISDFLDRALEGESLIGFYRSQQAFTEYRRQNCLWYLEFSSPRSEAEQIAKNCLADMSTRRLQELQRLLDDSSDTNQTHQGFYVYGADRNTFQPCGSDDRYWVEGDANAVGLIQQNYTAIASSERQVLHAVVTGEITTEIQAPEGYQGVLQLNSLIDIRLPAESDCQIPAGGTSTSGVSTEIASIEQLREASEDEPVDQEEPEQQLTAYFGDWLVDCVELSGSKTCSLTTALKTDGEEAVDADAETPLLVVNRLPELSTFMELEFPGQEIDSPSLIRWEVDSVRYGDIVDSEIRVDEIGTRQLISENKFLDDILLPALIEGGEMVINVVEAVDDSDGDRYSGTLSGLNQALIFADDFVRENG